MILTIIYCRIVQFVFKYAAIFLPWREPKKLDGAGSLSKLPGFLKEKKFDRILVVTDKGLAAIPQFTSLIQNCKDTGVTPFVFDETVPNPTVKNVEDASRMYKQNKCQAIVAFGGGSAMDCAKGAGIRIARPRTSLEFLKGMLKVFVRIPYLVAIPTTAGTGSEVTVTAVISDPGKQKKYPINDLVLIPRAAVLDAELTLKLPPHLTSTTGMDALTHAVEAYIGNSNTKKTEAYAIEATKLIFANVLVAYKEGANTQAREALLHAAHVAGLAFTRAYVGYAHSVAHALGGFYGTPHGLANAVLLPKTLDAFGDSATKRIASLAKKAEIVDNSLSDKEAADAFIEKIYALNALMDIPKSLDCIKESDLPALVKHALAEGNPFYPVPRIFGKSEMENLFRAGGGLPLNK